MLLATLTLQMWLDMELCNVHGTPGARYGGTYPGTSPGPVTLRPDPVPLRAMSGPFLLSGRCRIIPTTATIYPIGWVRSNPPRRRLHSYRPGIPGTRRCEHNNAPASGLDRVAAAAARLVTTIPS